MTCQAAQVHRDRVSTQHTSMHIDDLFNAKKARDLPTIVARIATIVERVRSHAVGFGACGCSAGMLSSVGFSDFEASLIHHVATTYPELTVHASRTIEDVVSKTLLSSNDKIEPALTVILAALSSYAEQCCAFRADEQD